MPLTAEVLAAPVMLSGVLFQADIGCGPASDYPLWRRMEWIAVTHVLLSYEEYERLTNQRRQASIIDELGLPPGVEDIEVEFPRSRELARPADFS